jgi:hypothetical protein
VRLRVAALALAVLALALHFGVARPAARAVVASGEEQRRLHDELRALRARLAELERGEAARQGVLRALAADVPAERAVAELRRAMLDAVAGASIEGVRLSVRPGRAPVAATAALSAACPLPAALRVILGLTRPGSGFVPSRVRLAARGQDVAMDVEGLTLGAPR